MNKTNVFDWWSSSNGTFAFVVTNMDWETFSKESHDYQFGEGYLDEKEIFCVKEFEQLMKEKGHEITVHLPTETADWWRD